MNEPDACVFSYCSCDLSVGQGTSSSSRAAGPRYAMACARDAHVSWALAYWSVITHVWRPWAPPPHTLCVVACAHARACLCGVRLRAWTERLVALRCIVHESGVSGHRAVVCRGRRARSHRSGIGDTARPWIVESRPCAGRLCEGRGRESLTCPGCRVPLPAIRRPGTVYLRY